MRDDEDDEPIHYFMYILPRIKRKAAAACFCGDQPENSDYRDFACYEFTQMPGETVFIPNGWWHAVLNITHTVGITQNFCSSRNFDEVWMKTRSGRKRLAWKWLCELELRYPHLAHRAKTMNARDRFVMKYDPVVMEMRRAIEEGHEQQKRQSHKRCDEDGQRVADSEGKEGEEKESDGKPSGAITAQDPPYIPSSSAQISYLDRSWKRVRITGDEKIKPGPSSDENRRHVSPP